MSSDNLANLNLIVFVLEDSATMQSIFKNMLNSIGITQIITCNNAPDAFELIHQHLPDVALVDQFLPDLMGTEFIHLLRTAEDSPCHDLSTILITGYASPDVIRQAKTAGVNGILAKPVSVGQLSRRIHSVVTAYRQENPNPRSRQIMYL